MTDDEQPFAVGQFVVGRRMWVRVASAYEGDIKAHVPRSRVLQVLRNPRGTRYRLVGSWGEPWVVAGVELVAHPQQREVPPMDRPVVGDKVKHRDGGRRPEQPPGKINRLMSNGRVHVQPFDLARAAWTADPDEVEPDDGIWYPTDGAPPAKTLPFPIPPGVISPQNYGAFRVSE